MNNLSKSAFITMMALVCYAGFATAQVVSLDSLADVSTLVKDLKSGGPGGHGGHGGGHVPTPPPPSHNGGGHSGGFGDHNGPGNHGGDHNGPGPNPWHPQPGPQPQPWHPQPQPWNPGPQPWNPGPQPWNPGTQPWNPQPGPWHPHHNGHPDWDNNDWNNNQWNNHGPNHAWWNNYDSWWNSSSHPYSMYRTACAVIPGVSAKGFIVERTLPFYGTATFYFYDAFDRIVGASSPVNGVYRGGDGTPLFDFYQVPRADHCFLAITR